MIFLILRLPLLVVKVTEKDYLKEPGSVVTQDKVSLVCCMLGEDDDVLSDLLQNINNVLNTYSTNIPTILIGTLNVFHRDWIYELGSPTTVHGQAFRDIVTRYGLVPKSREATWFQTVGDQTIKECVDFVVCSRPLRCEVKLLDLKGESEHTPVLVSVEKTYCTLCKYGFNYSEELESHHSSPLHKMSKLYYMYSKQKQNFMKNPNPLDLEWELRDCVPGISLSPNQPSVIEVHVDEFTKKKFHLSLKNIRNRNLIQPGEEEKGIVLDSVALLRENPNVKLSDENGVTKELEDGRRRVRLLPSRSYKIEVDCGGGEIGQHRLVLLISFYYENRSTPVPGGLGTYLLSHMAVEIDLRIQNKQIKEFGPTAPYERRPHILNWVVDETLWGPKVEYGGVDRLVRKVSLGEYKIPAIRKKIIDSNFEGGDTDAVRREAVHCQELLKETLSDSCYKKKMQLLLQCEELQQEHDIRHYDMKDVVIQLDRSLLVVLKVPGLSENRPSVLKGDQVFLKPKGSRKQYVGNVCHVGENEVKLLVSSGLVNGMKVDVRFSLNRFCLRTMHRAVEIAAKDGLLSSLFPTDIKEVQVPSTSITPYNRNIETNLPQLQAVKSIVAGTAGHLPYIIYGPPGTGKTVTIVEAMKQVLKLSPGCKILAAAPSNAAADLLAERLKEHIPRSKIRRVHALSRNMLTINENIKDISNIVNGQIITPNMDGLMEYDILVLTLCNSGRMVSAKFPEDHFTHVFIDECGHSTEPEAVIALAGILSQKTLATKKGRIVLAGDPKQLGPILRSAHAKKYGLDVSLLERMMENPVYMPGADLQYNSRFITKLVKNFRSHPAILDLPSRLFYSNELVPAADPVLVNSLVEFPGIPTRARGKFPLIFHGVVGQDQREERSPSFFNPEEIVRVLAYLKQLFDMKKNKVKGKEIGIIAPYRRQVEKIRQGLKKLKGEYADISVGSTEEFQGQERRVIIISCVRSQPEYVRMDQEYQLGFIRNKKRFNVAITRAKALMIVIGNPHVLGQDVHWNSLLEYVQRNGGYTGCPYTANNDIDMDRLEQNLQRLNLLLLIRKYLIVVWSRICNG
ncbi:putative helicase MOV-10 isoform X3 [Eurytemora carolleeae]|uniref:putative helicase MOV-10 isoform X3 n=1 Tax=Eurytemora carolleeae TaxID=1294199 RepID=UPI000C78D4C6|nr:putative helicase MOV-10 isoform X3 [Eurytemora carolleeae]|eukprot:XP_023327482.1 putative helicase MOV-10 isoform X3 [Eurytemora affinis]